MKYTMLLHSLRFFGVQLLNLSHVTFSSECMGQKYGDCVTPGDVSFPVLLTTRLGLWDA